MAYSMTPDPSLTAPTHEGAKMATQATPGWWRHMNTCGDFSIPHTPTELGEITNNPPQMSLPWPYEGMMHGGDRVIELVTPIPKLASNLPSKMTAALPQAQDTPLGSNIKTEAHICLVSGEHSNSSSMYVPSHGSHASNCNPKSAARFTSAMEHPSSTIHIPQRKTPSEVSLTSKDSQDSPAWSMRLTDSVWKSGSLNWKKPELNQTKPWSSFFVVVVALVFISNQLWLHKLYIYFKLTKVGSNWLKPDIHSTYIY
jgi:hypothetical protein